MQKIIKWDSSQDYYGPVELSIKLDELLKQGYRIIEVIPTRYRGSTASFIESAIIIIDEGRKEKLEKLNNI